MATTQPHHHTLRGSCSCGRNQYTINLPDRDVGAVNVLLDNSAASRRAHSAPLAAYIAVPLTYYHSTTYAFYPDENHRDIRRVYEVPGPSPLQTYASTSVTSASSADPGWHTTTSATVTPPQTQTESQQRHFCGYCGTHFSTWSSSPYTPSSADYIRVALESIADDDFATLYALGLLSEDASEDEVEGGDEDVVMSGAPTIATRGVELGHTGQGGREWFERMVRGSRVADLRGRRRDAGEVEEAEDGPGKRKREDGAAA